MKTEEEEILIENTETRDQPKNRAKANTEALKEQEFTKALAASLRSAPRGSLICCLIKQL